MGARARHGRAPQVVGSGSTLPLYAFIGSTWLAVFAACGSVSTTPAYEASLFGTKNVGAVHGRMLVFNSVAAIVGPNLFVQLRTRDELTAINELLAQVDPGLFQTTFGVAVAEAAPLISAKTITIAKLMALMPAGTPDPTPFLYNSTMYTMGGLAVASGLMHTFIRPVDPKLFEDDGDAGTPPPAPPADGGAKPKAVASETSGEDATPHLGKDERVSSVHDGGAKVLKD